MEGGLMSKSRAANLATSLEQQRKRAKELVRAHREGDAAAAQRVADRLPRARGKAVADVLASSLTLSEAQLVIAREAGYPSWPALKRALSQPREDSEARDSDEALLDAALAGDAATVQAALAKRGLHERASLALAAALIDRTALQALLAADPTLADRTAGRRGWTPLHYVCASRHRSDDPRASAERAQIARQLLALGADANAIAREPAFDLANAASFDQDAWTAQGEAITALSLAAHSASAELVHVLLAAGADANKSQCFVEGAVRSGDPSIVQLALDAGASWSWRELVTCVELGRRDMARLLVEHAEREGERCGEAQLLAPALHAAIRRGADAELIETLLGRGRLPLSQPVWQAAYGCALRHGHAVAAELLRGRGVDEQAVDPIDRLLGACVTGERAEQQQLSRARQAAGPAFVAADHRLVAWAVDHGRGSTLRALLEVGLDPDVRDEAGRPPLQLAVAAGSLELVETLLAAGARVDARDYDGRTPLEAALSLGDPGAREALTQRLLEAGASAVVSADREDVPALFERAADAVAFGELAALSALLDEEPGLVHARSPRSHRATLLHYCAANGTEDPRQRTPSNAPAIARALLERGADPNAECRIYGRTDTMSLLLTSSIPSDAGLDGELARELAQAGAKLATVRDEGPIVMAIQYGKPRAVSALVDAGVPVDDLLVAAAADRLDAIEALLARGDDVDTRFASGWTALHAAAATGHARAVELLLRRGADARLREELWGGTPAQKAEYYGFSDLAESIDAVAGRFR
jgi:ankyrin repeat protein